MVIRFLWLYLPENFVTPVLNEIKHLTGTDVPCSHTRLVETVNRYG